MSTSVKLEQVTKRFGDFVAVESMTLDIGDGEFFSLLGPSGCGKTTTLRMVAGFEQPTEGEVFIMSEPVAGIPAYQRPVNTVFQNYALFPHMTVEQNVAFGLEMAKVPKADISKRVKEALEQVQMGRFIERRVLDAIRLSESELHAPFDGRCPARLNDVWRFIEGRRCHHIP